MSRGAAIRLGAASATGVAPLGEIVSYGMVAGPDNASLNWQPANAIDKALSKTDLSVSDIDVFELNEAFAVQTVYCRDQLGIPMERLNVNGGSISIGHPFGMTGARLTGCLLRELKRRGGRYGIVTMCVGGGQGFASLFEAA